jgi:hypothetical protein
MTLNFPALHVAELGLDELSGTVVAHAESNTKIVRTIVTHTFNAPDVLTWEDPVKIRRLTCTNLRENNMTGLP